MTSARSQNVHGQPWVRISGSGFGPLPFAWMKWIGMSTPSGPGTWARKCGQAFIARSCARQSYSCRQWATRSRR